MLIEMTAAFCFLSNSEELIRLSVNIFSYFYHMKETRQLLTSFLSVYLLVLMILPCNDVHAHAQTRELQQVTQLQNEQHHEDFCTPFCACACCTTPIIMQSVPTFEVPYFDISYTKTPSFYKFIASSFCGSIWQPPQLV